MWRPPCSPSAMSIHLWHAKQIITHTQWPIQEDGGLQTHIVSYCPFIKRETGRQKMLVFCLKLHWLNSKKALAHIWRCRARSFFGHPNVPIGALSLSLLSISDSLSFIHLATGSSRTYSQDVIPLCPLHIQDVCSMTTAWWICLQIHTSL